MIALDTLLDFSLMTEGDPATRGVGLKMQGHRRHG
jgi:hypothetical protein